MPSTVSGSTAVNSTSFTDLELARAHLGMYFNLARGYRPARHQARILREVQEFLEDCWNTPPSEAQGLRVLVVNMPPGAGKSSIISATAPPWILGHRPFERMGIVSAKGDLAAMFENVTKADIESGNVYAECFPDEAARPDPSRGWAKGTLYLKGLPAGQATPSINTAGLFGSILGKRWTFLILDDPQDQETSRTPEQRKKTWEFINGTVLSRVIPGSPVICVQQRWHEDDVTGQLKKHYGAKVITLPALDDEGRSYWPEMYSADYLQQRRRADPHLFEANYQQQPGQGEGDIFKREWFQYYDSPPPEGMVVQSWDTAVKTGQENDYSARVEGVVTATQDVYLTDFEWQKLEFPQLVNAVKQAYTSRLPYLVLVEDKASGSSAIQVLRQQTNVPLLAVTPETDKVSRARSVTGWMQARKVYFPRHHPKLAEFEAFLTGFPLLSHDDPVDALTQLLRYVITEAPAPAGAVSLSAW